VELWKGIQNIPCEDRFHLLVTCSLARLACSWLARVLAPICFDLQAVAPSRIFGSAGREGTFLAKDAFRTEKRGVLPVGLEPTTY
jgi:hypothetical protein